LKPHRATIVPEKREEVTTEGGLYVLGEQLRLKESIALLHKNEIEVSLFIDPSEDSVKTSKALGVEWVEFHTGHYANIYAMLNGNLINTPHSIKNLELSRNELKHKLDDEISTIYNVSKLAHNLGLKVAGGHGLNYQNVKSIANIEYIEELNIGQSIIARSVFTGLERAILDMRELIK
jgi:pyridoxine 5-phosphate synthase